MPDNDAWRTWLIGALFSVTLAIIGATYTSVQARIQAEEAIRQSQVEMLQKLALENRERIASNEATTASVLSTLTVMNGKIDQLVQMHLK
jgi:hypothetical protein